MIVNFKKDQHREQQSSFSSSLQKCTDPSILIRLKLLSRAKSRSVSNLHMTSCVVFLLMYNTSFRADLSAFSQVQPEPVFARVPKMDLPQPQPQALPLPHTIVNFHPGVEWCPELSPPTRYSSSPETVPGLITPQSTPLMHPASIASHTGTPCGDLLPIPYQYIPLPLPMMMPSKTINPVIRPTLEAMIVVDLGSVKVRPVVRRVPRAIPLLTFMPPCS